jgi:hypothetical protein
VENHVAFVKRLTASGDHGVHGHYGQLRPIFSQGILTMSTITEQLRKEIEKLDLGAYYKERICMWAVSKDLRGDFYGADRDRQECHEPDCLTLKGHVKVKAQARSHLPCDSAKSRPLDGDIEGEIVFAHIENGYGRGYHIGKINWGSGASTLMGELSGVTNAGTHRPNCEPCDRRGHMEGRLDAVVVDGDHKGCRLVGAYAIDFDPSIDIRDSAFWGALEGVLICDCQG